MSTILRRRFLSALSVAAIAMSVTPSVSNGQDMMMKDKDAMHGDMMGDSMKGDAMMGDAMMASVAMDGYCPVCVIELKKWEKGNPAIKSVYDGVAYLFPSDAVRAKFDANPEKYVPALNGDCIVCYEMAGKRIAGSVQHPVLYNNRLYLFPSDKEKDMFKADAATYADSDLAVEGECIVCLQKMGKHVAGSTDHTVIHDGLRYLFPSEQEAAMFRQSPDQFVAKRPMMGTTGMNSDRTVSGDNGVRLVGRSGCAGCEFGVTPLSAPDELGLAVVGGDGRVTVVEGAHQNYPQIYRDRFNGQQLAVEGRVIRTEGNVSWIEPSSLMVVK